MMKTLPSLTSMTTRAMLIRITMISGAALLGYGGVRLALPALRSGSISGAAGITEPRAGLLAAVPDRPENLLERRLLLLDRMAAADAAGLRRLLEDDGLNRQEKRLVAHHWAKHDPTGLLAFLKRPRLTGAKRDAEVEGEWANVLFGVWAGQDAGAALAAVDSLRDRPPFHTARWEMIKTLFVTDPARAFAEAVKLPRSGMGDGIDEAFWQKNPGAFLKAAGEAPPGAMRSYALWMAVDQAFGEQLKKDPAAASAWLKALPPEQQRKFWSRLAGQLAKADPAMAQAWFSGMPPSAEREKAGAEIVKVLAQADPRAALVWLEDNLEGGRTAGFAYLAQALSAQGVDSARQLLDAMPPGPARDGVVRVIAQQWARQAFKPAIAWVLSLPPEDPGRLQAMLELGAGWPQKDLAGAAAWLKNQNSRQTWQIMKHSVTQQFIKKDPAGGFAWAASLPDHMKPAAWQGFFRAGFEDKKLPEVFAAMEKLPAPEQESVVGEIAEDILNRMSRDEIVNARYLDALKLIPTPMRGKAREAVEQGYTSDPTRKKAALEALR